MTYDIQKSINYVKLMTYDIQKSINYVKLMTYDIQKSYSLTTSDKKRQSLAAV